MKQNRWQIKSWRFRITSFVIVKTFNFIFFFLKRPSQKRSGKLTGKLLIFESDRLGDAVLCSHIISKLKNQKDIQFEFLIGNNGGNKVIETLHPTVVFHTIDLPWQNDNIFKIKIWLQFSYKLWNLRKTKYEALIDLRGDFRNLFSLQCLNFKYLVSNHHAGFLKLLSHCYLIDKPDLHLAELKYETVTRFLGINEERNMFHIAEINSFNIHIKSITKLFINPGASEQFREMSKTELQFFYDWGKRNGMRVIIIIPPESNFDIKKFHNFFDCTISIDLKNWRDFFPTQDTLYLGMDTGTTHLCAYLNQRTICIHRYHKGFNLVRPLGNNVISMYSDGKIVHTGLIQSFFLA